MLWVSCTLLALFASVQGRAVNISNTWVLPEEGFPVFYRYFRDRISWYEADAVCQFHHANLVTVDTTAQYDAVRAYLKELDISSAVWVGLIRSNPDGDFTWTDYRGLSGEGYWSAAPDSRAAPLCAAADPAADYRWEARACGGPTVASFICELPVPQWALGNDGCMVRALPALTVLYLPESAAVQLTADCGLAGVKRVQCTGNVKRDELLKDLSCNDEEDQSSTVSLTSASTTWPVTDTTFTEQETTTEDISTEDTIEDTSNTAVHITETATPDDVSDKSEANTLSNQNMKPNDFVRIPIDKNIILEQIHSNNIVSNEIPQPEHKDNSITEQRLKHMEDNKKLQHRLLHDEMSRLGNLDTIFTQPTDHFVPPLVMAKARISDDMTVLSLEEKHAQQIAEKRLLKHNLFENVNITPQTTTSNPKYTTIDAPLVTDVEQKETQVMPMQPLPHLNNLKKYVKSSVPKKYIDKYENPKAKPWKTIDYKIQKIEKIDVQSTMQILSSTKKLETTTAKIENELQKDSEEDSIIDLTVIIKEPGAENGQKIFYSNYSNSLATTDLVTNVTGRTLKETTTNNPTTEMPVLTTNVVTEDETGAASTVTLNHEIVKITVITDKMNTEKPPVVFEVATLMPVFNNNSKDSKETHMSTTIGYATSTPIVSSTTSSPEISSTSTRTARQQSDPITTSNKEIVTVVTSAALTTENITVSDKEKNATSIREQGTTREITDTVTVATTKMLINVKDTENMPKNDTVLVDFPANLTEVVDKTDVFNHTKHIDEESEQHDSDMIDDYQSPLLSAANEPLHRPNRSRRPQPPPNRMNKFNPFRILG